ncbi:MAG: HlyD family type I secretion periplasmic adaptor subunit [Rhodospirillales bacterium]
MAIVLTTAPVEAAVIDPAEREASVKATAIAAVVAVIAFVVALVGWMLFAELDSAVITSGITVVDSHRKTVQHLEGGILRELLVREGQVVKAGQTLAVLDTTQAESQVSQLANQLVAQQARIARLRAEQNDRRDLNFSPELARSAAEASAEEMLAVESRVFETRWQAYDSGVAIARNRIEQLRKDIAATQAQQTADGERLALYNQEAANVAFLLDRGYEKRPRMFELQRTIAELKGRQGEQLNAIGRAREQIAGAELEIVNLRNARLAEVARDLATARGQEADLVDRIRAARDVLNRREIVSPQDGVVVDLRLVTLGGVIAPGQPLMDIVPVDDELIVETRVNPVDTDTVHEGLPAEVRMTAFKRSTSPPIDGQVFFVSPDQLADPKTGEAYFIARIRFNRESRAHWNGGPLTPGMPSEVIIVTGKRRAIDYMIEPVTSRMRRAFREE